MTIASSVQKDLLPFKSSWTFSVYKTGQFWAFDIPEYGIKEELLVDGTHQVLDVYYRIFHGLTAKEGDRISVTVYNGDRSTPLMYSTVLKLLHEDPRLPDSHFYIDQQTNMDCWLCPFLLTMWLEAPSKIYVHFHWNG